MANGPIRPTYVVPRGMMAIVRAASSRRGGRVAEGARLESVCTGNRTEGSNPSLSANFSKNPLAVTRILLGWTVMADALETWLSTLSLRSAPRCLKA
jgi:hypothetical protein